MKPQLLKSLVGACSAVVLVGALLFGACTTPPKEGYTSLPEDHFLGAQLWSLNCIRCHNLRPASTFSDAEWEIVTHHMRVRANLTAKEHEQILRFLQASN